MLLVWEPALACKHKDTHPPKKTWGGGGGGVMAQTFIFCESVNSIANRSMPSPHPPVGGNPYSRAIQNVSSKAIASSSPDCRS